MKPTIRDSSQFLIIDDDPAIARFLVTYLRQRGHTCEALTDGFQTANWLSQHDCNVAVVDLKMPKVDGISLISFIREINTQLPIVVFTGVGYDEEQMHAAFRAGANGYVSKNLPIEQLYHGIGGLPPCRIENLDVARVRRVADGRSCPVENNDDPHAGPILIVPQALDQSLPCGR